MMTTLRNLRLRLQQHPDERGIALVSVIGATAVLAILVTAAVAFSIGGLRKSADDQDWNAALAAAYAGVEEYQSLVSNDPSYVRFGNAASPFTTPTLANPGADPTTVSTVSTPPNPNPAFDVGVGGAWAPVAGSDDRASYRYEVDNSQYSTAGIVRLRSTGKVGETTRSVIASLKQKGFVEFVYFTNFETEDPYSDTSNCNRYKWNGRPSGCEDIKFDNGDVIDGPAHSNDTMLICTATFKGAVTTESPARSGGRYYDLGGSGCSPTFEKGVPTRAGHIEMPPTNSQLKKETRTDLSASDVPSPGCLYTGPTRIEFLSNGRMKVWSPWTRVTRVAGATPTSGSTPPECGNISQLNSAAGAEIPVPPNNVVFVQNVPAQRAGWGTVQDPNYSASEPSGIRCTAGYVREGWLTVYRPQANGVGFPKSNESAPESAYGCRNGDLFVQGTLQGKTTLAAENFIYVTGDLTYADPQRDVLGLVGMNAVYVWNPVGSSGCLSGYCNSNRTINAAILSVAHTFMVQNYDRVGYRGELRVTGSIAQKYRGPVGRGTVTSINHGYKKVYKYDTRFKYMAPPKFLAPVSSTYGVTNWVETTPALRADGSFR